MASRNPWGSSGQPRAEKLLAQRDPATPIGTTSEEITRDVLARCDRLGFDCYGVAPATDSAQHQHLQAWLAAGMHDELAYMQTPEAVLHRKQPWRLLAGCNSFVMVGVAYAHRERSRDSGGADASDPAFDPSAGPLGKVPFQGRVARYARVRDYHDLIKRRLHALADALRHDYAGSEFRSFVDTAPVNERELAAAAGLGWQAKNAMLINPKLGSYLVLGGFATTLPLVASMRHGEQPTDHCGSCMRCIEACPTQAIVSARVVDARLCISNLTIERRTPIDAALQPMMGDWIAGCDICQQVCPHNSPRDRDANPLSQSSGGVNTQALATKPRGYDLVAMHKWTEANRREAFATSALKRISLAMVKRNAEIASENWSKAQSRE